MQSQDKSEIRLTEYSRGAGCGCKIAPAVLRQILEGSGNSKKFEQLLVGSDKNDDAAVFDLGNGEALISTTDFFMPIVDDAFDFGRVAAANAISDVYAMGGKPLIALAILGWPVDKLSVALASKVVEGARTVCDEAGIPLAGGHSIDAAEPMFGLSVNGLIKTSRIKTNSSARKDDLIFLTKPLGSGILSTAKKRKLLKTEDEPEFVRILTSLNKVGELLGKESSVHAVTDVTGFGLLGHLWEICAGSGLSAEINYNRLPLIKGLEHYISLGVVPDATYRNWNAYHQELFIHPEVNAAQAFLTLPDPQTNGGLLFTVAPDDRSKIEALLKAAGLGEFVHAIGQMREKGEKLISVMP